MPEILGALRQVKQTRIQMPDFAGRECMYSKIGEFSCVLEFLTGQASGCKLQVSNEHADARVPSIMEVCATIGKG
jgi:hypothetical protein